MSTKKAIGSRKSVWNGHAHHTSGGLTKGDIKLNRFGRLVSKKASTRAKARWGRMSAKIKAKFKKNQGRGFSSRRKRKSSSRRRR